MNAITFLYELAEVANLLSQGQSLLAEPSSNGVVLSTLVKMKGKNPYFIRAETNGEVAGLNSVFGVSPADIKNVTNAPGMSRHQATAAFIGSSITVSDGSGNSYSVPLMSEDRARRSIEVRSVRDRAYEASATPSGSGAEKIAYWASQYDRCMVSPFVTRRGFFLRAIDAPYWHSHADVFFSQSHNGEIARIGCWAYCVIPLKLCLKAWQTSSNMYIEFSDVGVMRIVLKTTSCTYRVCVPGERNVGSVWAPHRDDFLDEETDAAMHHDWQPPT